MIFSTERIRYLHFWNCGEVAFLADKTGLKQTFRPVSCDYCGELCFEKVVGVVNIEPLQCLQLNNEILEEGGNLHSRLTGENGLLLVEVTVDERVHGQHVLVHKEGGQRKNDEEK